MTSWYFPPVWTSGSNVFGSNRFIDKGMSDNRTVTADLVLRRGSELFSMSNDFYIVNLPNVSNSIAVERPISGPIQHLAQHISTTDCNEEINFNSSKRKTWAGQFNAVNPINAPPCDLINSSTAHTGADYRNGSSLAQSSLASIGCTLEIRDTRFVVKAVQPGSGAAEAGLQPGSVLVAVDNVAIQGLKWSRIRRLIMGPPQTRVRIQVAATCRCHVLAALHLGA